MWFLSEVFFFSMQNKCRGASPTKGQSGREESQLFWERNLELFDMCLIGGFNNESNETTILGGFGGEKNAFLKGTAGMVSRDGAWGCQNPLVLAQGAFSCPPGTVAPLSL